MRYHWGLAIGHVYTHSSSCDANNADESSMEGSMGDSLHTYSSSTGTENDDHDGDSAHGHSDLNATENCNDEDDDGDDDEDCGDSEQDYSDEELLAIDEMYGDSLDVEYYD